MTPEPDNDETPSLPKAKRGRGRPRRDARGEDLLSPSEAARRLGYTPKTIGRWIKAGTLPYVLVRGMPRVRAATVEAQVMVLPQAVEQSARTLGVRSSRTGRGMGSRAGKMGAMDADLASGLAGARKGRTSGGQPLVPVTQIVGNERYSCGDALHYTAAKPLHHALAISKTGEEGGASRRAGGGSDAFRRPENISIAAFQIAPG